MTLEPPPAVTHVWPALIAEGGTGGGRKGEDLKQSASRPLPLKRTPVGRACLLSRGQEGRGVYAVLVCLLKPHFQPSDDTERGPDSPDLRPPTPPGNARPVPHTSSSGQ